MLEGSPFVRILLPILTAVRASVLTKPNLLRILNRLSTLDKTSLMGGEFCQSQGLYLHRAAQHRKTRTNICTFSGILIHGPSNQTKVHALDRAAAGTEHYSLATSKYGSLGDRAAGFFQCVHKLKTADLWHLIPHGAWQTGSLQMKNSK
jgi:hypothetical protein